MPNVPRLAAVGNYMELRPDPTAVRTGLVLAASGSYVRTLDGIGTIAVSMVVCANYGLVLYTPGVFGATLVFSLSGYLITTLLFSEYGPTLNSNIPRFYLASVDTASYNPSCLRRSLIA